MPIGRIAECPRCKAHTLQQRTPVATYCTTCGRLWEFPTRIDPGTETTPEWAKQYPQLLAQNLEWLRLARQLKDATSDDEASRAIHEITECALGNGYLDLESPALKLVMDERERLAKKLTAVREVVSRLFVVLNAVEAS